MPKPASLSRKLVVRAAWFGAALGAVSLAFVEGSLVLAYSVYALLLVLLVSHLMAHGATESVQVTRVVDREEARIGERAHVTVRVKNTRPWPIPWVFVDENVPDRMPIEGRKSKVAFLLPGQTTEFDYQVVLNRRGYHRFGPAVIESGDLFGLHRKFKTSATADYVTVYPDILPIGRYEVGARRPIGPVRFAHRIFEDPTRIVGVREYVPGDSLNRIHWKATARTGILHSKVYEPSTVIGATLVLDFHQDKFRREDGTLDTDRGDTAVTVAASVGSFIAHGGEQIGLFTNGRDAAEAARWEREARESTMRTEAASEAHGRDISWRLRPFSVRARRGIDHAKRLIEALARVEFSGGLALDESLLKYHGTIVRNSALLVVTTRVEPGLALVLAEMKRVGFAVTVFIIMDRSAYTEAQQYLLPENIDVIHIQNEDSLREVATGNVYC